MKKALCFLIPLIALFAAETRAFALEWGNASDAGQTGELSVWEDGVLADTVRFGDVIEVTLTTPESTREYFYPYLYRYGEYDLTGYDTYAYRIHNSGSIPLIIHYTLTDIDGKDYRIGDSDSVVVMREGASMPERVFLNFGLLELEPGFNGSVYTPIDSVPAASLQRVVSYGVTVAVPGGSSVNFEFSDTYLASELMNVPEFRLDGPGQLQIPAMGDAVARYTVDFDEGAERHDAVFQLEGQPEDISITENGILTVNSEAKHDSVKISVTVDGLVKSGTSLALLENRQDFLFPEPGETTMVTGKNDPFFNVKLLYAFRLACVVTAIYLGGVYLLWKTAEQGNDEL